MMLVNVIESVFCTLNDTNYVIQSQHWVTLPCLDCSANRCQTYEYYCHRGVGIEWSGSSVTTKTLSGH